MIFHTDKYYADDVKPGNQIVEKEDKFKEQKIDFSDYGLISRIPYPNNIPSEKQGLITKFQAET